MLFRWLFSLLFGIASWLVGLFPSSVNSAALPAGWVAGAEGAMTWIGFFVDMSAVQTAASFVLLWWVASAPVRVLLWAWRVGKL